MDDFVLGFSPAQFLKMSSPGEIKAEFDTFYQKIEGEKLAQLEKENKLSEEFIQELEVRSRIIYENGEHS